jgi:hypothetical protein
MIDRSLIAAQPGVVPRLSRIVPSDPDASAPNLKALLNFFFEHQRFLDPVWTWMCDLFFGLCFAT